MKFSSIISLLTMGYLYKSSTVKSIFTGNLGPILSYSTLTRSLLPLTFVHVGMTKKIVRVPTNQYLQDDYAIGDIY